MRRLSTLLVAAAVTCLPLIAANAQQSVSASDLYAQFKANNLRAENQYKGRVITITGVFENIKAPMFKEFEGDNMTVTLKAGGFMAEFNGKVPRSNAMPFIDINSGEMISVQCVITGTMMDSPQGENCRLVNH
jgi:hypothetical protein